MLTHLPYLPVYLLRCSDTRSSRPCSSRWTPTIFFLIKMYLHYLVRKTSRTQHTRFGRLQKDSCTPQPSTQDLQRNENYTLVPNYCACQGRLRPPPPGVGHEARAQKRQLRPPSHPDHGGLHRTLALVEPKKTPVVADGMKPSLTEHRPGPRPEFSGSWNRDRHRR